MRNRRGFTLIEMLVVVTIIMVLASLLLFGMSKVQVRAMTAKTKSTVDKLHLVIMRRWDSYLTRRVPIDTRAWPDGTPMNPRDAAELRLVALRQLMRLELPDRWLDVTTAPGVLTRANATHTAFTHAPPAMSRTALSQAYLDYYNSICVPTRGAGAVPTTQFENAECLYMIVTQGPQDEGSGRALFSESEIGDVDGDGAPEFIDAWGMPIGFLRWPVGFVDDPRQDASAQAHFGHLSDLMPAKAPAGAAAPQTPCMPDAINFHDPFDPRHIDPVAFKVIPLIYSGGPDRLKDIVASLSDSSGNQLPANDDPFSALRSDPSPCGTYDPLTMTGKLIGIPQDLAGYTNAGNVAANHVLNHYDNITNQRLDSSIK